MSAAIAPKIADLEDLADNCTHTVLFVYFYVMADD